LSHAVVATRRPDAAPAAMAIACRAPLRGRPRPRPPLAALPVRLAGPAAAARRPFLQPDRPRAPCPARSPQRPPSGRPARGLRQAGPGSRMLVRMNPPLTLDYPPLLETASEEARQGLAEGGAAIGAALYHGDGTLLGRGRNRRVQDGDPSV